MIIEMFPCPNVKERRCQTIGGWLNLELLTFQVASPLIELANWYLDTMSCVMKKPAFCIYMQKQRRRSAAR